MFETPRRGRQARNFTTNAPKNLDLKSSSERIFSRKLPLGAPVDNLTSMCLNIDTATREPCQIIPERQGVGVLYLRRRR